jgi:hypothetical protein
VAAQCAYDAPIKAERVFDSTIVTSRAGPAQEIIFESVEDAA